MRTRAAVVALALSAALVGPVDAAEPRLVAEHSGPATADGRYVWFTVYPSGHWEPQQPRQPTRLLDTRKGTDQTISAPPGCDQSPSPSNRRVLFVCDEAPRYRMLDLDTGSITTVPADSCKPPGPAPPHNPRYGDTRFGAIGRHWLTGQYYSGSDTRGREYMLPIFFNWRTGECRIFARSEDGWRDADDPALPKRKTPRCGRRGVRFVWLNSLGGPDKPLALRLCRERRTVRIRCRAYCELETQWNGVVAWREGSRIKVQVLATGRRRGWLFTDHDPGSGYYSPFASIAGRTLFVSTAQREAGHWRIHAVDLPR